MLQKRRGFTIVELIIIVFVIGLITAIGLYGWNGLQVWSQNNTRANELSQWSAAFDLYKAKFAYYPDMPSSLADGTYYYCLGDFPVTAANSNRCGEYTSAITTKYRESKGPDANGLITADMKTELAKIGKVPANSSRPINNLVVGPYVIFDKATVSGTVTMNVRLIGLFQDSKCPSGTIQEASPPMGASISGVIIACKISKQLVYGP
jgi:type II secretory pathway pseudopilin PulG